MIDVRKGKSPCSLSHRGGKEKALGNCRRQSLDAQVQFRHLGVEELLPIVYRTTIGCITFSFESINIDSKCKNSHVSWNDSHVMISNHHSNLLKDLILS